MSQQANSKLHEFSHNSPVFDVSGDTLEQKEAEELQTLFWEVVDQANTYSKEQYKTIPADRSFLDYCIEKASELFGLAPCKDGAVDARDSRDRLPGTKNSSISPSGAGHVRWKGEQLKKKEQFIALAEMWGSTLKPRYRLLSALTRFRRLHRQRCRAAKSKVLLSRRADRWA